MLRFLFLFVVLFTTANAVYVAVSKTDGGVVELDASMYYSFNDHRSEYLSLYMPFAKECQEIIDAQLVHTDGTYRINDWFYKTMSTRYDEEQQRHVDSISVSVSVVDLDAFTRYAFALGIWDDNPSCELLRSRINEIILRDLFNQVKYPVGSLLTTTQHGLFAAFHCNGEFCTAAQLTETLRVSNNIRNLHIIN